MSANDAYTLRYIDFNQNPELLNANPKQEGWYEFESSAVEGTYVQGYVIPSEDTTVNSSKTYYSAPEKE